MSEVETKTEVVKEEAEISQEVLKSIGDQVTASVIAELNKKTLETEKVAKKSFEPEGEEKKDEPKPEAQYTKKSFEKAVRNKSLDLKFDYVIKGLETTTSDDVSDTIPAEDFRSEVARLEKMYGVAVRDANVSRTTNDTVTFLKSLTDITVTETNEAADIANKDLSIQKVTATIKKYAGYVLFTNEQLEDSTTDLYRETTNQFARAFAKAKDNLVFNDNTVGLLNIAGTNTENVVGGQMTDLTYANLVNATTGVIDAALPGAKFYMHRTIWGLIQQMVDQDDRPLVWPSQMSATGAVTRTLLGYPVELVEVMPTAADDALDVPFIVFGNLRNYDLVIRTEMEAKVLTEGRLTISAVDYDLGHQDLTAVRGRQRFGGVARFADAFSVIKTAVSS